MNELPKFMSDMWKFMKASLDDSDKALEWSGKVKGKYKGSEIEPFVDDVLKAWLNFLFTEIEKQERQKLKESMDYLESRIGEYDTETADKLRFVLDKAFILK